MKWTRHVIVGRCHHSKRYHLTASTVAPTLIIQTKTVTMTVRSYGYTNVIFWGGGGTGPCFKLT